MSIFSKRKEPEEEKSTQVQAVSADKVIDNIIGREQVREATQTLQKYKQGKANLESRIVENEQWWKLRHWEQMRKSKLADPEPASAWLLNCILSKHADAMDSFPEGNFLPREANDKEEAHRLSSIVPCILEQNKFEDTYSDVWWYKLKMGTGVYGVFWDTAKHNGLGDVSIRKIDLINLFWESGITDIQHSENLFHVEMCNNDVLEDRYPKLKDKLSSPTISITEYIYDDTVDTTNKSAVVDWYYKKRTESGQTQLHYVKYVNDEVLFATENETEYADRGLYDHGDYPFHFDVLFPEEGTPAGFGYIDICKEPQKYIDLLNQCILKNALMASNPRYFIRTDGAVNEKEFADFTQPFVHTNGNLGDDSIKPISVQPLNSIYVNILNNKIEELKETSGNRDVNNGGTSAGATAASAIAAMQEQSGKLSRDMLKQSYRTYRDLLTMCVELIRQFYDLPRCYRITGDSGDEQFVTYTNEGLKEQHQGNDFGIDMGYRVPEFDIEVDAQKSSAYTKLSQNELALQLFGAGFFNPQLSDQALACLDAMDFKGKELIMQKISSNATMFEQIQMMQKQLLQMAEIIDSLQGTNLTQGVAQSVNANVQQGQAEQVGGLVETDSLGNPQEKEHPYVEKAREQSAESTQPR